MAENITAEIIAIGTEILLGEITDTNSVYIARALRDLGINVYFMTSVGDNEGRIADAIRIAFSRADVVITCGGLGPTVDDMTRQAVARATERPLVFHQELLDAIAERFRNFRVTMTDNNRRQAFLPQAAILIDNPVGTAPSFVVEHQGRLVFSLPGVPREMKFLMQERVLPYLRQHYQLGIIKARVLHTAGIGESMLDDLIGPALLEAANPTVGLAAHHGQVDVRITAKAETESEADALIAAAETELQARVGGYIFGADGETLDGVLMRLLEAQHLRVAVLEAGIGGALAQRLQNFSSAGEQPGFAVFSYGTIEEVQPRLQFDPASLRDSAARTAELLCAETGAVAGIVVLSRAGDDAGDHADQEEHTVAAVHVHGQTRSRVYGFGGQAEMARLWLPSWTLASVWQMLREEGENSDESQR